MKMNNIINDSLYKAWKRGDKKLDQNIIFTPHNAFFNNGLSLN